MIYLNFILLFKLNNIGLTSEFILEALIADINISLKIQFLKICGNVWAKNLII